MGEGKALSYLLSLFGQNLAQQLTPLNFPTVFLIHFFLAATRNAEIPWAQVRGYAGVVVSASVDVVHRGSLGCGRGRDGVTARALCSLDQQGKLPGQRVGGWWVVFNLGLTVYHIGMLGRLNKIKHVKNLVECLAQSQSSINVNRCYYST